MYYIANIHPGNCQAKDKKKLTELPASLLFIIILNYKPIRLLRLMVEL